MSRDGRGKPGRIILKNQPSLTLTNVLRRRRTTLKELVNDLGVSTYAGLQRWCDRMGIVAPSQDEFDKVIPPSVRVNSPMEGVIVLEAPPVLDEISGRVIDPDAPVLQPGVEVVTDLPATVESLSEAAQKKRRPKKDSQPIDS